jgi:hypothetical protein
MVTILSNMEITQRPPHTPIPSMPTPHTHPTPPHAHTTCPPTSHTHYVSHMPILNTYSTPLHSWHSTHSPSTPHTSQTLPTLTPTHPSPHPNTSLTCQNVCTVLLCLKMVSCYETFVSYCAGIILQDSGLYCGIYETILVLFNGWLRFSYYLFIS